jgi:iron complex outermembrane receptor protein
MTRCCHEIKLTLLLYSIYLCFLLISGSASWAQDEKDDAVKLPEVLVTDEPLKRTYIVDDASTATKTDTPIKNIPQSIEVIDQDLIQDQAGTSLQDVIYDVSGAVPGDSDVIPFLLRGFRAYILRDGFTGSSFDVINIFEQDLADTERIEILQGPGSVLYGNLSAPGIINLVTKQPLPYFFFRPEVFYGSYDFFRTSLDFSTPLNSDKSLLFRINGAYQDTNSFRDFIHTETLLISPVLSWQLSPKVKLILDGEYFYFNQPVDEGLVAVGNEVADIPISRNLAEPTDKADGKKYLARATLETELADNVLLQNAFRYYKIHGYRNDHAPLFLLPDNRTLERFRRETNLDDDLYTSKNDLFVNLRTGKFLHNLLFGFEFIREDFSVPTTLFPASAIDIFDPVYGVKAPDEPSIFINRVGKNYRFGFYIQDQISLLDKLYILAGARLDWLNQDIKDTGTLMGEDFDDKETDWQISPRIGILYQIIPELGIYANFSRGFNLILGLGVSAEGKIFKPERSTQYEAGFKLDLFGGRLFSTVSAFRIDKKNAFAPDPINGLAFGVQVDKERSQGIEVDLTAQLTDDWNLIANYAFIDAKVVEDDFFKSGNELPGVAKNSGSLWTTYFLSGGLLRGFGLGAGFITQSNREGDLENTFSLGSFFRLDGAVYYRRQFANYGAIEAAVNFRNITDTRYFVNSTSRVNVIPGAPFTVLASLRYYYSK